MNREFLEFYDRELKLLYERAREFAEEYPNMAGRLGGLTADKVDPMVAGLLEGAAFLAARVQLKLKSEFSHFTTELIEQLLPGLLAPVPAFALVRLRPDFANPALVSGIEIPAGQYMETTFVEREKRIACRFRLVSGIKIWPYRITAAEYLSSAARLQAYLPSVRGLGEAGLRLEFTIQNGKTGDPAALIDMQSLQVAASTPDEIVVYLTGPLSDCTLLYEQLFSKLLKVAVCYRDDEDNVKSVPLIIDALEPIGFADRESLFGHDERLFSGFNHLREYFALPAKYIGFRVRNLAAILKTIHADRFEILFELQTAVPRLASVTRAEWFSLYAAPAANLFEMNCTPITIRTQDHEHAVIADRSRTLDYEVYRLLDVSAQFPRGKEKVPVYPLYSAPSGNTPLAHSLFYSFRRIERRKTDKERRTGMRSPYLGTETYISLREPPVGQDGEKARSLFVKALVTNRHLADRMPVGRAGADFTLTDETALELDCVAGPTPPRESMVMAQGSQKGGETTGALLWKLISLLQFHQMGLDERDNGDPASALRELMMVFSDVSNASIERQIRGIVGLSSRPIVRRIQQKHGFNVARGIEVTIEFDDGAFEGQNAFLFGAVLSRFFSEYASLNSFTETVISSRQRGILKRWRPQISRRSLL